MRIGITPIICLALTPVLVTVPSARAESINTLVSVSAEYWAPELSGKIKSTELGVAGSNVDLVNDLGADDSRTIAGLKASVDFPLFPELLLGYFKIDTTGAKILDTAFTYAGETYTAGHQVTSSFEIVQYEALLNFSLLKNDLAAVGILAGAKYFEIDARVKDITADISSVQSVNGWIPAAGMACQISLPAKLRLAGIARGLAVKLNGIDARLLDAEAAIHYDLSRFLRFSAGWRHYDLKAEDTGSDDFVELKFSGPFFGVTGSF